ncbi:hypothetical protein [Ligilactobacillus animalis]|nr:hypothetical protein [Ligilactobacillus animalis]
MLIDLLGDTFLALLISITVLGIVSVLAVLSIVVSETKKKIRKNNEDRRQ